MSKKILIIFIIFLALISTLGLFKALEYRNSQKSAKSQQKAAEVLLRFVEGWNIDQIASYLNYDKTRESLPYIIKPKDFIEAQKNIVISNYPLLATKPESAGLEGFLFPDSYRFFQSALNPASNTPAKIGEEIIKKMLNNFSQKFTPEMEAQAKKQNLSVYQIITLASIIEKETGKTLTEKKTVSGIFYNRLKIGMPLQSDATVNYATKKDLPSPTEEDTKINSPYNTYIYPGLPIGPICNPSLNSIMAALYPEDNNYLYFLHDQKTGQAYFAKTYDEHLANKYKYLK